MFKEVDEWWFGGSLRVIFCKATPLPARNGNANCGMNSAGCSFPYLFAKRNAAKI